MALSNLSADELKRIDAICLAYERQLRDGKMPSIDQIVAENTHVQAESLRVELEAIRDELQSDVSPPGSGSGPTQAFKGTAQKDANGSMAQTAIDLGIRSQGDPEPIESGTRMGPYQVETLIGQGGMGSVYRAYDSRLDRRVAIKVLADDWIRQPDRMARFERESRAVAALHHHNIVSLYDVGNHDKRPYAVMELLDGETLRDRLLRDPLSIEDVRQIGAQTASALAAAHDCGILHRDLKPENLMLVSQNNASNTGSQTKRWLVKLLDFGLSNARDFGSDVPLEATRTGVVMGTAGYMSPEQARGEKVTAATDLFSLGCVLFECFYGRKAFAKKTLADSLSAVLLQEPPVDDARAAEDPDLAHIISQCLQKSVDKRPKDTATVARWLDGSNSEGMDSVEIVPNKARNPSTSASGPWRLHRRTWLSLCTGAAGGVAGLLVLPRMFGTVTRPINSLAVLPRAILGPEEGGPIGGRRKMAEQERVAAMLVNQLAKLPDLSVVPFRPIKMSQKDQSNELRELGRGLNVGGLVLVDVIGTGVDRVIALQLVDTATSEIRWGAQFPYGENKNSLLERIDIAARLAKQVGRQVDAIKQTGATAKDEAFGCLIKGDARSDLDSDEGLHLAVKCFQHAVEVDDQFADAHIGLALASMALAAREKPEEAQTFVMQARTAISKAMQLSSDAPLAHLANGILLWQCDRNYSEADAELQRALQSLPNHWQAYFEYSRFMAACNQPKAIELADRAVRLNPLAIAVRLNATRIRWFQGLPIEQQLLAVKSVLKDEPKSRSAIGCAIDLYESAKNFHRAAQLQNMPETDPWNAETYYPQRLAMLEKFPYGPFGPIMNRAIAQARFDHMNEEEMQHVIDKQSPMSVFLLAAHPAFAQIRNLPSIQAILPSTP